MTQEALSERAMPFADLSELRSEHLAFLKSWRTNDSKDTAAISAFRNRVVATGSVLKQDDDRDAAQDILEYWGAQLLSVSGGDGLPDLDLQIDAYREPEAQEQPAEGAAPPPPSAAAPTSGPPEWEKDPRAQIRLSALARQWRQSDYVPGYLLTGNALAEAARYRASDPEIGEFVTASEAGVRRSRWIQIGFSITLALSIALGILAYFFYRQAEAVSADNEARAVRLQATSVRLQTERIRHAAELQDLDDQLLEMKRSLEEAKAKLNEAAIPSPSPALNQFQDKILRDSTAVLTQAIDKSRAYKMPAQQTLTAGEQLLANINLIDGPDADQRRATTDNLVRALRDNTVSPEDQRAIAGGLINLLARPAVQSLTLTGRYNLLYILSTISDTQWADPAWSALRDKARAAAADLVGPNAENDLPMGADSQRFYRLLVQRLQ